MLNECIVVIFYFSFIAESERLKCKNYNACAISFKCICSVIAKQLRPITHKRKHHNIFAKRINLTMHVRSKYYTKAKKDEPSDHPANLEHQIVWAIRSIANGSDKKKIKTHTHTMNRLIKWSNPFRGSKSLFFPLDHCFWFSKLNARMLVFI